MILPFSLLFNSLSVCLNACRPVRLNRFSVDKVVIPCLPFFSHLSLSLSACGLCTRPTLQLRLSRTPITKQLHENPTASSPWHGIAITTKTTAKQLIPGSRFWGELFSMHVHDPATSVLEIGLWDKGEEGAIPLSVTGVFRGAGGKELVGTARVPLPKVCMLHNCPDYPRIG